MKKKWLKIGALIIALVLILGLGWFANALVGNPVSKWIATGTAGKHLEEVYAETDFVIERVSYSFKDGKYYAYIKSPSSKDSAFALCIDCWGNLKWDSYEDCVSLRRNTADRLYMEYRALTDAVFESPAYPFTSSIAYGDLEFVTMAYVQEGDKIPEHALVTEELELDKIYDIREFGAKAGRLVVYVEDETVTVERAAEILLELKNLMDAAYVPFYCIDFVLEYPRSEEDGTGKEGRVEVRSFLYTDIQEEGMTERVEKANEEAMAYYMEEE